MLTNLGRFLGTTTLVLTILISASFQACAPEPESVPSKLEITQPVDGDTISMVTTFKGISPELPAGSTIWICSLPANEFIIHWQATTFRMVQESGLRWQASVWVGTDSPIETGREYQILAVVADERATQELQAFREKCEAAGIGPIMLNLPEGTEIHAQITVIRE